MNDKQYMELVRAIGKDLAETIVSTARRQASDDEGLTIRSPDGRRCEYCGRRRQSRICPGCGAER